MLHFIKVTVATLVVLVPLFIDKGIIPILTAPVKWGAITVFTVLMFLYNIWHFKPDRHFEELLEPIMNIVLGKIFEESWYPLHQGKRGERFPFQVSIMRQKRNWLGQQRFVG